MKLLTYNILGGYHLDKIRNHLDFNNYSFICLQEYPFKHDNTRILNKQFDFIKTEFLPLPSEDNMLGSIIFFDKKYKIHHTEILSIKSSKLSLTEKLMKYLILGRIPEYRMNQLLAKFNINGHPLTIVNIHLFWESDMTFYISQLNRLLARLSHITGSVILVGDFNTYRNNKRTSLRELMKKHNFKEVIKPSKYTLDFFSKYDFPSNRVIKLRGLLGKLPIPRIFRFYEYDYVFYKNLSAPPKISMPYSEGSDHFPIEIEFELP